MNELKIQQGKHHRMRKSEAMEAICEFALEDEMRLIQEGKKRKAKAIRHARKTMAVALTESLKNLRETLDYMTETFTIESGRRAGQETFDLFLYIRDDEVRELVRNFKVQLFKDYYVN